MHAEGMRQRISTFVLAFALCLNVAAVSLAAQDQAVRYVGNAKSRIYHNDGCKYFTCKACTVRLASPEDARAKGFRACKVCRG